MLFQMLAHNVFLLFRCRVSASTTPPLSGWSYIYKYIYTYIHIYMFICICTYLRLTIFLCPSGGRSSPIHLVHFSPGQRPAYIHIYTYTYIYIYIYIYIQIDTYICKACTILLFSRCRVSAPTHRPLSGWSTIYIYIYI